MILGLKKFIGIISIVVGLALAFAGSKFIPLVLGVLLGSGVFFFCFLIGAVVINGTGAMIGLTVVGLILGGAAGYFGYKVLERYGTRVLAFVSAAIGIMLLTTLIPQIPPAGKLAAAFVGGIFGFVLSGYAKAYIESIGTAIIGSGMFVLGLDQYLPGLPDVLPKSGAQITQLGAATFGYLAGFVVLVVIGSFI